MLMIFQSFQQNVFLFIIHTHLSANVANKYKHRPGLRVSRGAFVWIYVRNNAIEVEASVVPPPEPVVEYVLHKQEESTVRKVSSIMKTLPFSQYHFIHIFISNTFFSHISVRMAAAKP